MRGRKPPASFALKLWRSEPVPAKFWTVRELATYYRVGVQKIYEEIAAGRLQAIKSPYRIRDDWRQDWEDARKTAQVVTPQQFIRPRKYIPKHLIAR